MFNVAKAKDIVSRWMDAANRHDVDAIVSFYAPQAELQSPVIAKLLKIPDGRIQGLEALRAYFTKAIDSYPYMSLQLIEAAWGLTSITVWYVNHRGTRSSAYLAFDSTGRITQHVNHFNEDL